MVALCTRAYRAIELAVQGCRPGVVRGRSACEALEARHLLSGGSAGDDALTASVGSLAISAKDSAVLTWVVPTDEEAVIARHTAALTAP